ncbi:hypothetical protein hrd7_25360 [Leptolinea sp. HRD-7]|nr:hypothetical protein hrd7_25360 [Leptolinea sp. HRD-7]
MKVLLTRSVAIRGQGFPEGEKLDLGIDDAKALVAMGKAVFTSDVPADDPEPVVVLSRAKAARAKEAAKAKEAEEAAKTDKAVADKISGAESQLDDSGTTEVEKTDETAGDNQAAKAAE